VVILVPVEKGAVVPARQAYSHSASVGSRELTAGEFRRFVEETGYLTSAEQAGGAFAYNETSGQWEFRPAADWRRPGFRQADDHPVVNVSWFDAAAYCNWLSTKEGLKPAYTITGEDVQWDRNEIGRAHV
jgi:formylglycine-generating enzyme required for sulfatase activity